MLLSAKGYLFFLQKITVRRLPLFLLPWGRQEVGNGRRQARWSPWGASVHHFLDSWRLSQLMKAQVRTETPPPLSLFTLHIPPTKMFLWAINRTSNIEFTRSDTDAGLGISTSQHHPFMWSETKYQRDKWRLTTSEFFRTSPPGLAL